MKFQTTSAFPQVCILLFLLFFQIGDEEERAAAEMIDKTDHEDGKKEIFCLNSMLFLFFSGICLNI